MNRNHTQRRSFVMMAATALALLLVHPLQGEPEHSSSLANSRPNILVILSDDHGILDSGCYGNRICRTPHIDRLAAVGLRFTRAFTATAMCTPSRSTLYTGLYAHRHGAHANHSRTRDGVHSLPHYLKPLGYRVGLAGKTHIKPRSVYPFEYMERSQIEGFLARRADEPFCLIFATHDPHTPFKIPPPGQGHDRAKIELPPYLVDTPLTRAMFDNYYTSVEALDTELGNTLNLLDRLGLTESTFVVYVSDHGSGAPFCKWTLYDAGINVPCIMRWPGQIPVASTDAMITFVDFLPTFIELAGGTVPDTLDGKSFLPLLEGQTTSHHNVIFAAHTTKGIIQGSDYPIRAVGTRTHKYIRNFNSAGTFENLITRGLKKGADTKDGSPTRPSAIWPEWVAAAAKDPKARQLVHRYRHRPAEEFYDLRTDPLELNNLANDTKQRDILIELRVRLADWMKQQRDPLADQAATVPPANQPPSGKNTVLRSRPKEHSMMIQNRHYELIIDERTGSIRSLKNKGRQLTHQSVQPGPLFTLRFRDAQGKPIHFSDLDSTDFSLRQDRDQRGIVLRMEYKSLNGHPVHVRVRVTCPDDSPMTFWNLSVEHDLDHFLDHIEFPNVIVPDDLIATGGDARIFWPAMEGVLIDNMKLRESTWMRYQPVEFPIQGWQGYYPASCPMQFMAYYGEGKGLYIAAHDEESNIKGIDCHPAPGGGIQLDYRLFPGAITRGQYTMPYDMAIGVFEGDWHDAADIYRNWVESSDMPLPPRLSENARLPDWFADSPVVVTYPVRGTRDLGDMSPNEFYPYTNALPHMERLAKAFDSKVMALLMHWEGTAPWAPPYVWPPYGSLEDFRAFVRGLHDQGNLAGVYASGFAYTIKSNLNDFSLEDEFNRENLARIMAIAPDGELRYSKICSGPHAQRFSYDMCASQQFVEDVVSAEIGKIVASDCDYIQYFDQNLGGACYLCYSKDHGHPPAPGVWMKDAMVRIYERLWQELDKPDLGVLIGCEAAAAEPFIRYLPLNDLRFEINFWVGTPVPAYAYVYHEYVNNFMGNQNNTCTTVDAKASPLNLHQRVAYAFTAGDMLTVVLKGKGEIHWDWGSLWDVEPPDQESIITLIRNLNAWRTGTGRPFLCLGRMVKPYPLEGTHDIPMKLLRDAGQHHFSSLLTSRWQSPDGRTAQVVVNYTPDQQEFAIQINDGCVSSGPSSRRPDRVRVYEDPHTDQGIPVRITDGEARFILAPLSAILIEF